MKYFVSMCLAGVCCRYDGKSNKNDAVIKLVQRGDAVMACPEQLGGLTTPRLPSEIVGTSTARHVINSAGENLDIRFMLGAQQALNIAKMFGAQAAILKSHSPSCGVGCIYDGTFSGNLTEGNGITAQLFIDNGIKVYTEDNFEAD
ncbi:MAG: DUF523 domain-containing protein [Eubacteriaceae bacterium]|nr:DUF523 domain-containing protein [Eubacteriaceae bacterium]